MLSTKRIVSLISINRPPPLFLWRSCRTATHHGVLSSLVLLVGFVDIVAMEKSQQFSDFATDSVRFPLHQS